MIQFRLKRSVSDLKLRISDAAGKKIRDIAVPANRNQAGIQTVCWDLRVEPNPADSAAAGGRGGGGGGGRGATPAVPGIPTPEPAVGYLPMNPCGEIAGVGTAGFGIGGPANFGPYVMPATYSVALMSGDRTLDTKRMKIIMDPAVKLADVDRRRYDAIVMELHDAQRAGMQAAAKLNALYPQMTAAATKMKNASNAPAALKSQFDALTQTVRRRSGQVRRAGCACRPRRGGGGGRGGANPDDVLAQLSALKVGVGAMWESPTAATVRQAAAAKLAVQQAVSEANAFVSKAAALSEPLKAQDITLTIPPASK